VDEVAWHMFNHMWRHFGNDAWLACLLECHEGFSWVLQQLMLQIAIDQAFTSSTDDGTTILVIMAMLYAFNVLLTHLTKHVYIKIRLGGRGFIFLREAAVNTMLELNLAEQERFPIGEMVSIIDTRLGEVVTDVWCKGIQLVGVLFTSFCIIIVALITAKWKGLLICIALISATLFIMWMRDSHAFTMCQEWHDDEDKWKHTLMEFSQRRPCITAYRQSQPCGVVFKGKHGTFNKTNLEWRYYLMTTDMYNSYAATIVVVFTYILIGRQVLEGDGDVKKGDFVVLIGTLFRFDAQINKLFETIQTVRSGYNATSKLSELFNAKTRRQDLLETKQLRLDLLAKTKKTEPLKEGVIYISKETEVHYYTKQRSGTKRTVVCLPPGGVTIELGQMAAVHSDDHGVGKNTFLKAISRIFLPAKGFICYPDNLRVRYLSKEPHMFNQSIMENLRFGNIKYGEGEDATFRYSDEEVANISRKLEITAIWNRTEQRFNEGWQDLIVGENGQKLSQSDCILLCIARALLSSVDLLLLGNCLDTLNQEQARTVLKVLREMVLCSGVEDFAAEKTIPKNLKKKKTVLIATAHTRIEQECDSQIKIEMTFADQDDVVALAEECERLPITQQIEKLNQMTSSTKAEVLKRLKYRTVLTNLYELEKKQLESMDDRASVDFAKEVL